MLALAQPSTEPLRREPLLAFVSDEATREVLLRLLEERKLPPALVADGGVVAALKQAGEASPHLLVVDVSESSAAATDIAALAAVVEADCKILVLGTVNDVGLFRDLIAAGASDYLVKPISPYALQAAILEAQQPSKTADNTARLGRVIVFQGARGGVGTTTAAVNAAWLLAHEHHQKVALVDFDFHFGTIALALDLDPGHGLREALERPSRIDSLFIERSMVKESERLFVLGAEEPLQDELVFDPSAPDILLHELKQKFDWVVIDLPRGAGILQCQALAAANHVALVCDMSLAGMRDAIRVKGLASECMPEAPVILLAASTTGNGGQKVSPTEFERGIEQKIEFSIPYDAKAVAAAVNAGRPLPVVARDSKVVKTLRQLTIKLAGDPKPRGRKLMLSLRLPWKS